MFLVPNKYERIQICGKCEASYLSARPYTSKFCFDCRDHKAAERSRRFAENNPERLKEHRKNTNAKRKNSGKTASTHLKYLYGITSAQYLELVAAFPSCGICGVEDDLVVDHCHSTGKIRGRLCRRCNLALGNFSDSVELIKKTIDFLKQCGVTVVSIEVE